MTASDLATVLGGFLAGQVATFWLFFIWRATRVTRSASPPPMAARAGREENGPPLSVP